MLLQLKTPAASYPITIDQLRAQANIDPNLSDDECQDLIAAATNMLEFLCNRSFVSQTWTMLLPNFPHCWDSNNYYAIPSVRFNYSYHNRHPNRIELPVPPAIAVNSVKYYDSNNTQQTLVSGTDYRSIFGTYEAGWIEPILPWPSSYCRGDAVEIEFVSGFSGAVPPIATRGIRLIAANWNVFREAETSVQTKALEVGLDRIVDLLRAW